MKMNSKVFFILCIAFIFGSCKQDPKSEKKEEWSNDQLSLTLNKYWKVITEEEIGEGAGLYLEIENEEPFSSGLLLITSANNQEMTPETYVEKTERRLMSYLNEEGAQAGKLIPTQEKKWAGINGSMTEIESKVLTDKQQIRLFSFRKDSLLFLVNLTANKDDWKEVLKDSEDILMSLKTK